MSNKKTPPGGGFLGTGFGLDECLLPTQSRHSLQIIWTRKKEPNRAIVALRVIRLGDMS